MMMLVLNIRLEPKDYIALAVFNQFDDPDIKKKRVRSVVIRSLIYALVFGMLYWATMDNEQSGPLILYFVFILAFTLLVPFLRRRVIEKITGKFCEDPRNEYIFLQHELRISENGIMSTNERVVSNFKWSAFIKLQELPERYYLYITTQQALIIPKRAFSTADDAAAFKSLLSKYLSFQAELGHFIGK